MTKYYYIESRIPPIDKKFIWALHVENSINLKDDRITYYSLPDSFTNPLMATGYIVQDLPDDVIIVYRLSGIIVTEVPLYKMTSQLQEKIVYYGI